VKILLGHHGVLSKTLLLFDGSDCSFRKVSVRDRNPCCAVCGTEPSVTALIDYEQFCGSKANDKVIVLFVFSCNFLEYFLLQGLRTCDHLNFCTLVTRGGQIFKKIQELPQSSRPQKSDMK
jgi:hypothetical protein